MKSIILFLIIGLGYLLVKTFFDVNESIIDLKSRNQNQMVSWTDTQSNQYLLIRLSDITIPELIPKIYQSISMKIPNYDVHSFQNSAQVIKSLKNGTTQIIREPILAIKATHAIKLTNNKFITGSIRDVGISPNKTPILIPYLSNFETGTNKLAGSPIKNRIIQMDKILYLDQDHREPIRVDGLGKLYLAQIYTHMDIPIYVLEPQGSNSNLIQF
jgi:hypothetical protein